MNSTIVMIMAGGRGTRLGCLTTHRAKPAVPFGGRYRIIDFVLSNAINSGYRRIYVLTQYMASSLIKHLARQWHLSSPGEWIELVPAQMRRGEHWYRGTADSIVQNLNLIRDSRAQHVAILGGDHIYKCALHQMEQFHREVGAQLTIAAYPVPRSEAHQFGVLQVDATGRIVGFQEKPSNPEPIPGRPDTCLVSMGNYFFQAPVLIDALLRDADDDNSSHDFGKDVIPGLVNSGAEVFAYDFGQNRVPGEPPDAKPYWRDVGTTDSYFQANMDLRSPLPALNMYNREWRIRTGQRDFPPARFVQRGAGRAVEAHDSLICEGSIVESARLSETLLGYDCFVHAGASIEYSLILAGSDVGPDCHLRKVLADKNVRFERGAQVGLDPARDAERFPFVTEGGLVVLPKGTTVPAEGPIRLAHDMATLLARDPATSELMAQWAGRYEVSAQDRHSYQSAGPRYNNR